MNFPSAFRKCSDSSRHLDGYRICATVLSPEAINITHDMASRLPMHYRAWNFLLQSSATEPQGYLYMRREIGGNGELQGQ